MDEFQAGSTSVLSTYEAARFIGVSPRTLMNWRWRRIGPSFMKYGDGNGAVRYLVSDLREWLQRHIRRGRER
jgi:Helix-turn-helix domain